MTSKATYTHRTMTEAALLLGFIPSESLNLADHKTAGQLVYAGTLERVAAPELYGYGSGYKSTSDDAPAIYFDCGWRRSSDDHYCNVEPAPALNTYGSVRAGLDSGDAAFVVSSGDWGGEGNAYRRDGDGLYGGTAPRNGQFPTKAHDCGSRYYFDDDLAQLAPAAKRKRTRKARRPAPAPLTDEQRKAIKTYRDWAGADWKMKLTADWMRGGSRYGVGCRDVEAGFTILYRLRNTHGPSWLASYDAAA